MVISLGETWRESILKNWHRRIIWWMISIIVYVLILLYVPDIWVLVSFLWIVVVIIVDELLKEGYFFNKEDLYPTHENLILFDFIALLVAIYYYLRGVKHGENTRNE